MYQISTDKLEEVTRIFNQWQPDATEEIVKVEICADWHEGDEHQVWINNASAQEIADWLASFVEFS